MKTSKIKTDGEVMAPNEVYCSGADCGSGLKMFAFPYSENVVIQIAGERAIISVEAFLAAAQLFSATCKKPK